MDKPRLAIELIRLQADVRTIRMEARLNQNTMSRLFEARLDQMSEILFAIADKLGVDYRP